MLKGIISKETKWRNSFMLIFQNNRRSYTLLLLQHSNYRDSSLSVRKIDPLPQKTGVGQTSTINCNDHDPLQYRKSNHRLHRIFRYTHNSYNHRFPLKMGERRYHPELFYKPTT